MMNCLKPGLCSLLCVGYDENGHHLELTAGAHFENLGLYELVRKRVGAINVSDAGVDKDFKFGDLTNAIEKVRTVFADGAFGHNGYSKINWVSGIIRKEFLGRKCISHS